MLYVIAILGYLLFAAAHTAALERIFDDPDPVITTMCGLIWPLTAPFICAKLAFAKLLEKLDKEE